ncbi:hypothetical protein HYR69_00885 [Candidatus Sumerlaeota bacterium]|nr:hypothetical protein [Candidatus Sumerlaeota bacterium]MBI3735383.1 hypothetical protein [Candidatus Sumerlaeota bacterium]
MKIELTPEQQLAIDQVEDNPPRVYDPRTHSTFVLVPESEYEAIREALTDERREAEIHALALRNAAGRLMEEA